MVQRIRELCKKKGITIAELERRCGIGNGIIARWENSSPSYKRLANVAAELETTVEYLQDGKIEEPPAPEDGRKISRKDVMFALWGNTDVVDEDDLADVQRYADFILERKKKK